LNTTAIGNNGCFKHIKVNLKFYRDPMAKKKMGDKLMWQESERGKKKKGKERRGYQEQTGAIFSTHLI
jgi:hypothetical protein